MAAKLDLLLDQYDGGHLNRRQLLKALALATGGALGGPIGAGQAQGAADSGMIVDHHSVPPKMIDEHLVEPYEPIAPAASINHVHLNVTDVKRSMEFYAFVLGAKPKASGGPHMQTMSLPGARKGFGSWLSLSDYPDIYDKVPRPGTYNHVGFGVTFPTSEFPRVAADIKHRFPEVRDPDLFTSHAAGSEIYFWDTNGVSLQLIQIDHDGELSGF